MLDYVRNAWYVAAWSHEVTETRPLGVRIMGEPIVLWRTVDDIAALADSCVHRMAPLSLGECQGGNIRCMYHGLLFDHTGQCIAIPGQDTIPARAKVRRYPVIDRHSWIWVWMGNEAEADPSTIPDVVGLDDPDWCLVGATRDFSCEARIINENLLDFSHLSYVHARGFEAGLEFAAVLPNWEILPRGVRYTRWTESTLNPPGFARSDKPVDFYLHYDYLVPGVQLMWSGIYSEGTARQLAGGVPSMTDAQSAVSWTNQAVTPVDKGKARYFFSLGPHRDYGGPTERDQLMAMTKCAFDEDEVILLGQQSILDATPDAVPMPTRHDKGITLYNNIIARLRKTDRTRARV